MERFPCLSFTTATPDDGALCGEWAVSVGLHTVTEADTAAESLRKH